MMILVKSYYKLFVSHKHKDSLNIHMFMSIILPQ